MELVANIWPVVDESSGIVQRFFIKAYAMKATDEEINNILSSLAKSDYRTANLVAIPKNYKLSFDNNEVSGAVTIDGFNQYMFNILEGSLKALEAEFEHQKYYGFNAISGSLTKPNQLVFPENPYIVSTTLLESINGHLNVA